MNAKKLIIILLILMMLSIPITFAKNGDYTVPSVVKDITVEKDGSTVITEKIVYEIEGSVNGVFRDIPLKDNQSVINISVKTPGYYNKLDIERNDSNVKMKVWLYNDEAKTQKTNNEKVEVTYKYTITKGLKIYNDIAELQYMTWGNDWNTNVDHMESNIHIPCTKDDVEYWNNPETYVTSSEWTSTDTLTTKLDNISSKTSFEQRLLMPKDYFENATNAQIININAKDLIEQNQREYKQQNDFNATVSTIYKIFIGLLCLIPFGVYLKYGREPKIDYDAEYEYDVPSDESPVQVNAIMVGDVGEVDIDAIPATILDLIDRKYYRIVLNDQTSTIIRRTDKDASDLREYEKSIIAYLSKYEENGDISIGEFGKKSNRSDFRSFMFKWLKDAKEEVASESVIEKYFDNSGNRIFRILALAFMLFIPLSLIFVLLRVIPIRVSPFYIYSLLLLFVMAIIIIILPNTLGGRWTREGKEKHEKWKNFKKYIKDYSLIEERPPASVQVWGRYLVYAAALGCADEVTRNMKQYLNSHDVSEDYFSQSSAVSFAYYNGFAHVESSVNTFARTDSDSGISGIGSAGSGGFGGGGGGTF
ncbi:DUF2207 domain-containing protein [Methanosphaera sp. BMS]|uniref:DUF2207 domain-containing protein n=1 Tax=Methanosphaera sp. BMS TaxID=1789762 RepID=UPI000DC1F507|nr:DUF2207 domain-containing protein [Methanosphaera sp. BMS]AWX31814.1 hypothetical protein AW729_01340 [Methanosphaera sp. BMS]